MTKHDIFKSLYKTVSTLENFDLSARYLNDENTENLSEMIIQCQKFKKIYLSNQFSISKLRYLVFENLWPSHLSLAIIDFSCNYLNENEIKNISQLFLQCNYLKSVNLSSNLNIRSTKEPLFDHLKKSSATLTDLYLSFCDLSIESIKEISDLLSECYFLKVITLYGNQNISFEKHDTFKNLLNSSLTLDTINLTDCNLNKENIINASNLLKNNAKFKVHNQNYL